ncbi:MAG TPA: hypothetical protein ENH80_10110 [Phycisphaerae bacterium]|nr:hypothetical protein [Phycisphaerae bacterium]HDZ44281.1 hypothetical protein [Phycisphaerae bacterium]
MQITPTSEKVLNGRFEKTPLDDVLTVIFEQSDVRVRRSMGLRNILVNVTFEDTPFWQGMLELCKANNLAILPTSGDAQIHVGLPPNDMIDMKVVGKGLLRASVGPVDNSSGADPSSVMLLEYFHDHDEVWFASVKSMVVTTSEGTYTVTPSAQGSSTFMTSWKFGLPGVIEVDDIASIHSRFEFSYCVNPRKCEIKPEQGQRAMSWGVAIVVGKVDLVSQSEGVEVWIEMSWDNGLGEEINERIRQLIRRPPPQWTDGEKAWAEKMVEMAQSRHMVGAEFVDGEGKVTKLRNSWSGELTGKERNHVRVPTTGLSTAMLRLIIADIEVARPEYTFTAKPAAEESPESRPADGENGP